MEGVLFIVESGLFDAL
jgi:hypothetical protein